MDDELREMIDAMTLAELGQFITELARQEADEDDITSW